MNIIQSLINFYVARSKTSLKIYYEEINSMTQNLNNQFALTKLCECLERKKKLK